MRAQLLGVALIACLGFSPQGFTASFRDGYNAYTQESCKKAFRIWYFEAAMGDPISKEALGLFALWGCPADTEFGALKNPGDGIEALKNSDQPELLFELAKFFDQSDGAFHEPSRAAYFYEKAYDGGLTEAALPLYRLTKEEKWREVAISLGDNSAICEDGLLKLNLPSHLDSALRSLEACPSDQKLQGLLRAAEILRTAGEPDRALELLATIPPSLGQDLRDDVALAIVLKKGIILERKAEEQFRLAKLEKKDILRIQNHCRRADEGLNKVELSYRDNIEQLPVNLDKTDLTRALGRVIDAQDSYKSWCTSTIDGLTFTIEKALADLEAGRYKRAWSACKVFEENNKWGDQCNFIKGIILFYGYDHTQDKTWGRSLLQSASDAGFVEATLALATISVYEDKLDNVLQIQKMLERLARSTGSTVAQRGNALLLRGDLEKRIIDEKTYGAKTYYDVKKWYEKSRDLNYWPAYAALGVLYHENKVGALTIDAKKRAFELFKLAGDHDVKKSYQWLCEYYATGTGTARNQSEANQWCKKAVETGHRESAKYLN